MNDTIDAWTIAGMAVAAAIISTTLILLLRPFLARYALARPNARSSHAQPTPQGGGIAVIAGMIIVIGFSLILLPNVFDHPRRLAIVLSAALGLAIVGVTDDVRPLEVLPRLLLQAIAVAIVVATLPSDLRVVPILPWWLERACLLVGGVWFVNLVNFMDGIDWMTVVETVPVTAALAVFGAFGALPPDATIVSATLCAAVIGFAPFNRPVARLFLGDVGSLPIGLLLFWLLALLASGGHLVSALLLPLYYIADATLTLINRLRKGESITAAHRSHFYQRAADRGFNVYQIVGRVFAVNLALAGLAGLAWHQSTLLSTIILLTGFVLVLALLRAFDTGRS